MACDHASIIETQNIPQKQISDIIKVNMPLGIQSVKMIELSIYHPITVHLVHCACVWLYPEHRCRALSTFQVTEVDKGTRTSPEKGELKESRVSPAPCAVHRDEDADRCKGLWEGSEEHLFYMDATEEGNVARFLNVGEYCKNTPGLSSLRHGCHLYSQTCHISSGVRVLSLHCGYQSCDC